jgi:hypothetical protein
MKNLLFVFSFAMIINQSVFGEETALKNFRFGIKATPNFCWMAPDDVKQFNRQGISLKFNYGLITEFKLTKTAALSTGFDFNNFGGKIDFLNKTTRYATDDKSLPDTTAFYYITSRTYKIKTYEIPLTLKLRTPEIGSLTYFGVFGVNIGIRGKVKSDDFGKYQFEFKTKSGNDTSIVGSSESRPDNIITKDMNLVRLSLNVGLGTEYNLAGSTSLVISINYYNSFLNALKNTSENLEVQTKGVYSKLTPQNIKSNGILVNVGFLF